MMAVTKRYLLDRRYDEFVATLHYALGGAPQQEASGEAEFKVVDIYIESRLGT